MRRLMLAVTAAVAICGSAAAEPVRISVGSYNLNNLPFPVAVGLGLFQKEGLDITVENFASGGSKTLQALVAGSTDVAVGFYDHTIQMQSQNKSVVGFVLLSRNSGLVLAGGKSATFDPARPETIKGAKIGITAPGSSSDFFVRYYLKQNKIPAESVYLIGVGSGAAAVAALEQGKIDLLVNYDPAATYVEQKGIGKILIDARSDEGAKQVYGGIYPTSVLYATQQYIAKNPGTVQKITNAMVKALRWIATHNAEEIVAVLPNDFISGEKQTYTKAVEKAKAIFSRDGQFDETDVQTPLLVLKSFNDKVDATSIDLAKTYTNAFAVKAQSVSN
ncbi:MULTISPECIES: ABC transporter substrate-binding protein [unclassified Bradyrhizobium]|uniref:ABC transporter substrate-binding protein n=1 Tax=unclassified Bradyrhizobium TaxID=2631580 RepID=UPI0028EC5850|nr:MULTISPECIES: ABC transporter substrate-binding protein [unclassified Bradyrhizobium]